MHNAHFNFLIDNKCDYIFVHINQENDNLLLKIYN